MARGQQDNYAGVEEDCTLAIARGMNDAAVYSMRAIANVYLECLESAQHDCEQAEERESGNLLTHIGWGYLHLALREYDQAIARFESILATISEANLHFALGLALLLSGRFDGAKASYSTGLVEAPASDIRAALRDLEFWTECQADNITSVEAKETVADIRRDLQTSIESKVH
jgi:tetratricopeptide (TPR) repeat protein